MKIMQNTLNEINALDKLLALRRELVNKSRNGDNSATIKLISVDAAIKAIKS